ncbi:hydroxymethylglutaryl-CoA lyase [Hypericibacter terrae]|uniref:Hydroxymethylglutaryl-CoA lyase n=2 Tax=Hypericibacter terrae TaxID=2602015 RepID=A0A5J6MDP4_9PROT|nr:hydroxymethylglutaryl-CoA lyase [Hypericibacter terrae]
MFGGKGRLLRTAREFHRMRARDVEISEVGLRDGLQNTARVMATAGKKAWITAEAAAGVGEIEVCSFVPAKLFPQFADADEVVAHARSIPGLAVAALVPNLKGAERAAAAGAQKLTFTISVSRSHSLANVRRTPEQQLDEFRRIVSFCDGLAKGRRPFLSTGLSTVFGCTLEGAIDEGAVCRLAAALLEAGADDLSLADTVGYANPAQVRRIFKAVQRVVGDKLTAAHFHNTRGLGLANVLAALEVGIRTFDSSLAGLGGCPFAPGASGNIVTEDLVFMLEALGLRTGIDLEALIAVRRIIEDALPGEPLYGHLALAGAPKGFIPGSVPVRGTATPHLG